MPTCRPVPKANTLVGMVPRIIRFGDMMIIDQRWRNQWVVVGGGSRGLGLAIAKRLAACHSNIAVIGRDQEQLQRSKADLLELGANAVETFSIDLTRTPETDDDQVVAFQELCDRQSIALCVAAVGKSDRGFLQSLTATDLHDSFSTNVVSSLQLGQWTSLSLRRCNGQIVFIASIAGLAVPGGMGAYSITKAAQIALARQFRRENPGIGVTLVCTGPIARGDAGSRYEHLANDRDLPEHLNAPGGGVRITALDANVLAERILMEAAERKSEMIIPWKVRVLLAVSAFFPTLADRLVARSFRKS